MRTRVAALWREHRTIVNWMVLFLLGAFVIFEVGVRLLTPDAVRYNVRVSPMVNHQSSEPVP